MPRSLPSTVIISYLHPSQALPNDFLRKNNFYHCNIPFARSEQISTKKEDYLVDTIALHDVMAILQLVFANPEICKVTFLIYVLINGYISCLMYKLQAGNSALY